MFAVKEMIVKQFIISIAVIYLLYSPGISRADDADSEAINWALQNSLGEGVFIGGHENAQVYKLPLSYTYADAH